ncbi:hypothetical protein [Curtobacterium sp. MCPF17_052]|uniref:hypothetical protein n=1 Tax=Curtobacterium sp. MCPF17_052 TaxID=2175655 RepID=UPI0024DF474A|nr:hypothetical protein [Curtobacterium sp. MCPF17_052]WIB11419.1 hypothetical protein DEJ36_10355 [Curtobacterium sp. MCPF17_052]
MKSVLGDRRAIVILLGPALLIYSLVMLVPLLWSLGYTFFSGSVVEGVHLRRWIELRPSLP